MAEVKEFTKIWHCTKLQNSKQSGSAFIPTKPQNFAPSSNLKTASNKIMIQTKLEGMSKIFYYTKVHLSKCNGSWVVSTKQTMNFNIQLAAMFVFFVFDKNCLIKICSSFEDLSVYKISYSHVDWCKFCINLRSLNVRHFGMVEGTGLKSTTLRSPSMAWPSYWIS
jgi:hypothetical protein